VIGSYFAAEWMRKREVRRTIAAHEESLRAAAAATATGAAAEGNGNGAEREPGAIGSGDDALATPPDRLSRR